MTEILSETFNVLSNLDPEFIKEYLLYISGSFLFWVLAEAFIHRNHHKETHEKDIT